MPVASPSLVGGGFLGSLGLPPKIIGGATDFGSAFSGCPFGAGALLGSPFVVGDTSFSFGGGGCFALFSPLGFSGLASLDGGPESVARGGSGFWVLFPPLAFSDDCSSGVVGRVGGFSVSELTLVEDATPSWAVLVNPWSSVLVVWQEDSRATINNRNIDFNPVIFAGL